jgi:ribonuclease III
MSELAALEAVLRYSFRQKELLNLALTHCSSPLRPGEEHNEKLEFLGDSVLGLAMSDLLMRRFPQSSEGDLSKLRASLVNAQVLALKASALSLGHWLRLGGGEERSGGREKLSILASA